ncbi:MAG TPA: TIM barrel protein [Isosphaeraceae bacterium]|jgi:hydroxypyruvate isomerase|nr:TIM barrel protein [Isosphaeraceae bacterium]
MQRDDRGTGPVSRRTLIQGAAGLAAAGALATQAEAADEPVATRGRVRQSLCQWCYQKYWDVEGLCRVAKRLGCTSVELVDPKDWPTLKKHGLACAIANSHWFDKGMNNPKYHDMCISKMTAAIDACAEYGFPSVITFTGYREDVADDAGIANCVAGYKKVVGHAERKGVTLCLEMLNSRVAEEMKGHPGYQGDHTDYCLEIIRKVGSPRLKLLFDIYHVQIMDGDVIRRLRQDIDLIGHVHTAGNPGRGELDDRQEINYPPIMRALVDAGYKGYVGQEFIPTRDPFEGLKQAVALCDV